MQRPFSSFRYEELQGVDMIYAVDPNIADYRELVWQSATVARAPFAPARTIQTIDVAIDSTDAAQFQQLLALVNR